MSILPILIKYWRIWAGAGAVCAVLLLGWYIHHKGYQACVDSQKAEIVKAQEKARTDIIKVEKRYEPVKTKIIKDQSDNPPVGHRVELAIDSMRDPSKD